MSDTTNKTPGQVAFEAYAPTYFKSDFGKRVNPWGELPDWERLEWDKVAAAVLAHTAPKWHPVSEPVPDPNKDYWLRHGGWPKSKPILIGGHNIPIYVRDGGYTHWCGPIEPPTF